MKILDKLLIVIFWMSLCFSCTESDEFIDETPLMLKKAHVKVMPSNLPTVLEKAKEDWGNISEALNNAGPGETVMLGEGTFYLHKSLVCLNFNGIFKGAGMHKTIIQTAPGIIFDVGECPDLHWSWQTNGGHFMICFPHEKNDEKRIVTVSDLKFVINEPATDWYSGSKLCNTLQAVNVHYVNLIGNPGPWYGDLSLSDQIDLNVQYKNITVIGDQGTEYRGSGGFSVNIGLAAFGASSGTFEAKNIHMTDVYNGINPHVFCGANSLAILKNCTVKNAGSTVYSFLVSGYEIKDCKCINMEEQALCLCPNNLYVDYQMPVNTNSDIKDNLFISDSPVGAFLGIKMKNVQFCDNIFKGIAKTGIYNQLGENWSIKDNNFCGLNVTHSEGVTILLDDAKNCEVKDNWNQVVGSTVDDPSNVISNPKDCN